MCSSDLHTHTHVSQSYHSRDRASFATTQPLPRRSETVGDAASPRRHMGRIDTDHLARLVIGRRGELPFEPRGGRWVCGPTSQTSHRVAVKSARPPFPSAIRFVTAATSRMSRSDVLQLPVFFNVPTVHRYLVNRCNCLGLKSSTSQDFPPNQSGDGVSSGTFVRDLHFFFYILWATSSN